MNIEQAKAILISQVLEKLECKPQRTNAHKAAYFSPLRNERTPSFFVDNKINRWKDFGDIKWKGGDVIRLVQAYLDSENENCEVKDALRWLRNMMRFVPLKKIGAPDDSVVEHTLVIKDIKPIKSVGLIKYADSRGIDEAVLRDYCQEAVVFNTKTSKTIYTICIKNESDGYELRNPFFKGCLPRKDITFIRGSETKPEGINIFEGFMDFLTIMSERNGFPLEDDTLILNSLTLLQQGSGYLKGYGYKTCYTWMDNDAPGIEAAGIWAAFCKTEQGLLHKPMNELYKPHKDVNEAHAKLVNELRGSYGL